MKSKSKPIQKTTPIYIQYSHTLRALRLLLSLSLLPPAISSPQNLRSLSLSLSLSLESPLLIPMAFVARSSMSMTSISCSLKQNQGPTRISGLNSVSLSSNGKCFPSLRSRSVPHRFQISCAAKPATVDQVCEIVRKQLALPAETAVTGDSKFTALGADSLDTVEIVMGLEEAFGISVEEESAQSILTVQDAAEMIDRLIEAK
ncbi:acyl carrier protein 1, chloroplastic-like [Rhododendron vialii]|uniref:acyl carrier protein 1, chloroplastic-like n=1 Tax=Rhododendron vialii TaxID=182163 RepID=UPI00265EF121|nr:acyl carrier protein 1, chloroplastic-like [Rhododendron vialii]